MLLYLIILCADNIKNGKSRVKTVHLLNPYPYNNLNFVLNACDCWNLKKKLFLWLIMCQMEQSNAVTGCAMNKTPTMQKLLSRVYLRRANCNISSISDRNQLEAIQWHQFEVHFSLFIAIFLIIKPKPCQPSKQCEKSAWAAE